MWNNDIFQARCDEAKAYTAFRNAAFDMKSYYIDIWKQSKAELNYLIRQQERRRVSEIGQKLKNYDQVIQKSIGTN